MAKTVDDLRKEHADKKPAQFLKNADLIEQNVIFCLRSVELEKRTEGGWSWKLHIAHRTPEGELRTQHTWLPAVSDKGKRDEYRGAIMRGLDLPAHTSMLETLPNSRYIELTGPHGGKCACSGMSDAELAAEMGEEDEKPPF